MGSRSKKVFALDAATGDKRWEFSAKGGVVSSPAVGDGLVFITAGGDESRLVSSPVFADGFVYVGATSPVLQAIRTVDGTLVWEAMIQKPLERQLERDGAIHLDRNQNTVHAYDAATGVEQWAVDKGRVSVSTPAVDGRCVYIGNGDGKLWALERTDGTERWAFQTGGRVAGGNRMESSLLAAPAVADGAVFVPSTDRFLYVLQGCPPGGELPLRTVAPPAVPGMTTDAVTNVEAGLSVPCWVVCAGAIPTREPAEAQASDLSSKGFNTGVLWIPDYGSLSGAKYWLVYVGPVPYSDRAGAEALLRKVQRVNTDAYLIKIDTSGPRETIR